MLIDNSKFLALVAALSAASAGCLIVDASDSDDNNDGGNGVGGFSEGGFNEGGSTQNASGGFGGGEGGACLDDVGSPPDCVSDCEGYTNCGGIHYFKEGVAENLVNCLNGLNPATCSFVDDAINVCALDAMNASCVDDTSSFTCSEIASDCFLIDDEAWQSECGAYVDGLNDLGRAIYAECAVNSCTEGANGLDLPGCIVDLFP